MKNIKIYIIAGLTLTLGALVSCNHDEFLEETPLSLLAPPSFPSSAADADLILGGISNTLESQDFANRSLYMVAEIPADETVTRYTSGDRFEMDQFNFTLTNAYIDKTYKSCFKVINQANLLIKYLPVDQPWATKYIAAAKFYRAWMYSYLVRLYGPSIILTEPTEVIGSTDDIVRAPELEVFNFIVSDLQAAEVDLPLSWTGNAAQTDDGRPSKGAAKMLLAKMYITMAGFPVNDASKWALAKAKAQEVINLGPYSLQPGYANNFLIKNENNPEHILSFQFTEMDGIMTVQCRPTGGGVNPAGFYLWQAQPSFMSLYPSGDERLAGNYLLKLENVNYTSFSANSAYPKTPAMAKFQDFGRPNFGDNNRRTGLNIPVFRIAEAYLIVAEAENEVNGPTGVAYDAINKLRVRAKAPNVTAGLSKDLFRKAVQTEWSLECAFEMKRRFNLLRWGTMDAVLGADERAKSNYMPYKKYLPIPQSEFDKGLNPKLQNPGY